MQWDVAPLLYGPRVELGRDAISDGGAALEETLLSLQPPTHWQEAGVPLDAADAPDDALQLEWVYGARGHDVRSHVHWTRTGEVLFHAATVGVVFDPRARSQRFFTAHTDDILCASLHPNGVLAATGQAGAAPFACVWDTRTMELLASLRSAHSLGICASAFDQSGQYLVRRACHPKPHACHSHPKPHACLSARRACLSRPTES